MNSIAIQMNSRYLDTESDNRTLTGSMLGGIAGVILAYVFSQMQFDIHKMFYGNDTPVIKDHVVVNIHKPTPKPIPKPRVNPELVKRTYSNTGGKKVNSKGSPTAQRANHLLAEITSRTQSMNQSAYKLMEGTKIHQDIDKVLQSGARLVTKGQNSIGSRRGSVRGEFNVGLGEGGTDGINDVLANLFSAPQSSPGTRSMMGKLAPPKTSEISMPDNNSGRSVQEIMSVVRSRMSGLRHIFNKHLKIEPGMSGKVTLSFTILPGGDLATCTIVSSTTGNEAFDQAIRSAVLTWHFKAIKAGNTTVTMPFTFTE